MVASQLYGFAAQYRESDEHAAEVKDLVQPPLRVQPRLQARAVVRGGSGGGGSRGVLGGTFLPLG